MPETPPLRPAAPDEIAKTLSFTLRYEGRKRVPHADDMMARITAERLAGLGRSLVQKAGCAGDGLFRSSAGGGCGHLHLREERRVGRCHRGHQQGPIQKQVAGFAARLRNE